MPIRIEFTDDSLGVIAYNEGLSTSEEITIALTQIYQDERYPKLKYWIRDLSKAEKLALSFEETKQLADLEAHESRRNPGILLAIIIGTDDSYAISSMFKAFAHMSKSDINIVTTREKADEWILSVLNNASQSHQNGSNKPFRSEH